MDGSPLHDAERRLVIGRNHITPMVARVRVSVVSRVSQDCQKIVIGDVIAPLARLKRLHPRRESLCRNARL